MQEEMNNCWPTGKPGTQSFYFYVGGSMVFASTLFIGVNRAKYDPNAKPADVTRLLFPHPTCSSLSFSE